MKIAGNRNNNLAGNKTIIIAIVAAIVVVAIIVGLVILLPSGGKSNGKGNLPTTTTKKNVTVTGISVDSLSRTTYYVGQDLDFSGVKILVSTTNKADNYIIDGNDANIEFSGFDSSVVNDEVTVYVSYKDNKGKEYTTSFVVAIEPMPEEIVGTVTALSVVSTPKTVYDLNEALDIANIVLAVKVAERDEPYYINAAYPGVEVSGFDSSVENPELIVTFTYKEFFASCTLIVRDKANYEVVILSLNIVNKPKTTYKVGEPFDSATMKLQVVTQDYTNDYFVNGNDPELSFSGFDSSAPAENQVVTVTYKGVSTTFTVTIKDDAPSAQLVSVSIADLKTTYTVEKWNKNKLNIYGAYWVLTYENGDVVGSYAETPLLNSQVPALDTVSGPCELQIVFTYQGVSTTVTITITE